MVFRERQDALFMSASAVYEISKRLLETICILVLHDHRFGGGMKYKASFTSFDFGSWNEWCTRQAYYGHAPLRRAHEMCSCLKCISQTTEYTSAVAHRQNVPVADIVKTSKPKTVLYCSDSTKSLRRLTNHFSSGFSKQFYILVINALL